MIGQTRVPGQVRLLLLALVVLLLAPLLAGAETILIRNECPVPVVIQVSSVFGGVPRRDPPQVLRPTEISMGVQLPGNKIINVHDARNPNRILCQVAIPPQAQDQYLGIVPIVGDPLGRVRLELRRPFMPR